MVSIVLAAAISSHAVKAALLMFPPVRQDAGEDDHDQRLGLQKPADLPGFAALAFQQVSGGGCTGKLASHGRREQQAGRSEHCGAARAPFGQQAGCEEADRHHGQQDVIAEKVHLRFVKGIPVEDGPGRKGADHEMKPCPVREQGGARHPDQAGIPAIACRYRDHQLTDCIGHCGEQDEEEAVPADAFPVEQYDRQQAPDRDVVKAGIAQHPLAERQAQHGELFEKHHEDRQRGHGAGHADSKDELPRRSVRPDPALSR